MVSQLMILITQHVPWLFDYLFQMQLLIFLWAQGRGEIATYILQAFLFYMYAIFGKCRFWLVKQRLLSINWSLPYKVLEILHLWTVNIVQLLMFWSNKKKHEANFTQNAQANHAKRRPDGWQKLQGRKEIRLSFLACPSGKL